MMTGESLLSTSMCVIAYSESVSVCIVVLTIQRVRMGLVMRAEWNAGESVVEGVVDSIVKRAAKLAVHVWCNKGARTMQARIS